MSLVNCCVSIICFILQSLAFGELLHYSTCFLLQRLELETDISKVKLEKVDLDTHLRAKLASVESQLMTLELEKAQEKAQLQDQVVRIHL